MNSNDTPVAFIALRTACCSEGLTSGKFTSLGTIGANLSEIEEKPALPAASSNSTGEALISLRWQSESGRVAGMFLMITSLKICKKAGYAV